MNKVYTLETIRKKHYILLEIVEQRILVFLLKKHVPKFVKKEKVTL